MSETNWLPGLVVLAAGVVAGVLFVLFSRRAPGVKAEAARPQEMREDLEERYRSLVAQLKELEADRHLAGEARYASEKDRLEREAVAVLRAQDERAKKASGRSGGPPASAQPQPARPTGILGAHPQLKGALWGGGVVLFFVVLGLVLSQEQKPKDDAAMPPRAEPQQQEEDPQFLAAVERMRANPEDVEAMAEVAHELIRRQEFDEAGRITAHALGVDPFHLETRVHRAVAQAVNGDAPGALAALERLGSTYPSAHEAFLYAGALAMETGNRVKALECFERFLAEAPPRDHPPMLPTAVRQLRAELGAGGADGGPHGVP